MTWRQHHCWSLACDVCGDGWDDAGGDPHFVSMTEARLYAEKAGWVVTPLRAVCSACGSVVACALSGHTWGAWQSAGPFPRRDGGGSWQGRVRHCVVCTVADWDPPVR